MDEGRIVIGEEDLDAAPDTAQTQPQPPPLPTVDNSPPRPLPGGPGPAGKPAAQASVLNDPRWSVLLAAAAGILLGWAIAEVTDVYEKLILEGNLRTAAGVWVGILGICFGLVYSCFDRILAGAWEDVGRRAARAVLPLAVAGFISGFVAQWIYGAMISDVFAEGASGKAYLARAVGWAVFGGGIGLAVGLLDRSRQRAVNGLLGGLAGGGFGGLVFEYLGRNGIFGDSGGRLVGLLAVGLGVAFAIRLVETVRREAWLRIVAGGMSGKEFIIYHQLTRIGASPECEIFLLKDSAVQKEHARILDRGDRRILTALGPVAVNDSPVNEKQLRDGDQIRIGATTISYSERAVA